LFHIAWFLVLPKSQACNGLKLGAAGDLTAAVKVLPVAFDFAEACVLIEFF
jgi:hypothetical protein